MADYRRLLDSRAVEALVVAAPTSSHSEIVLACLAAGKHVSMAEAAYRRKTLVRFDEKTRQLT